LNFVIKFVSSLVIAKVFCLTPDDLISAEIFWQSSTMC